MFLAQVKVENESETIFQCRCYPRNIQTQLSAVEVCGGMEEMVDGEEVSSGERDGCTL